MTSIPFQTSKTSIPPLSNSLFETKQNSNHRHMINTWHLKQVLLTYTSKMLLCTHLTPNTRSEYCDLPLQRATSN